MGKSFRPNMPVKMSHFMAFCMFSRKDASLLHRDRRWLLRSGGGHLSVWVSKGLALRLTTEHHRVARTSWMREAHLALELGEHDAQCQGISIRVVKIEQN